MDKIPNEVISIQFRKDYILVETIEGCREIEYGQEDIPHVWIDNLQAMGLSLYQWQDKVKRYGPQKKKST